MTSIKELSNDLNAEVMLKKLIMCRQRERRSVKRKTAPFYSIEIREFNVRIFFFNFSSVGKIFSECLKTCLLLKCKWEMMRIGGRGIKEKRGIIYKVHTSWDGCNMGGKHVEKEYIPSGLLRTIICRNLLYEYQAYKRIYMSNVFAMRHIS